MSAGMRVTLLLAAICGASAVTPIEKVIQLLKDLDAKVLKQGQKEAIQYEKYACFCKDQANYKKAGIAKSADKITVLDADIQDLESNIGLLAGEISTLTNAISKLEANIESSTDKRKAAHTDYLAKAKDLNEAIASCQEGINKFSDSKNGMSDAKLNLAQLKTAALNAQLEQSPATLKQALSLLTKATGVAEQNPAKYTFQANDIIATIQGLQTTFKQNKADLDFAEISARDAFDSKILGYTNQKNFKSKELNEKTILSEAKTAEKNEAQMSRDTEDKNKKSDEAFLKNLVNSCEQKAKDWDQRSTSRAAEMAALAEATSTLEQGALHQYSANKKLVGLVRVQVPIQSHVATLPKPAVEVAEVLTKLNVAAAAIVSKPAVQSVAKEPQAAVIKKVKAARSFLEVRSAGNSEAAVLQRVLSHLDGDASRFHSPVLAALALKVQLKGDHFSNVRSLIKDLVSKLKADAAAESTTKGFCDKQMKAATDNRDKASQQLEEQNGIIATQSSLADAKQTEIEGLSADVAELNKSILEAQELRTSEKADNAETVAEATAGGAAVGSALATLQKFYTPAFLQASYKPPNSDRDGVTVGDAAPKAFSGEYSGSGESATGILGLLNVVQADFERTVTSTKAEEKAAAAEHAKFLKDTNEDIQNKSKSKGEAQKAKEGAEQAVVAAQDDHYDAEMLRASATAELEKLAPMCVDGEETYEERVAKRQTEITSLKEATQLLDEMAQ